MLTRREFVTGTCSQPLLVFFWSSFGFSKADQKEGKSSVKEDQKKSISCTEFYPHP
jgi:hypothetical protein